MKKTYKIDTIPSFSYNIDIPTGFSSLFNNVAKAQIYLFGSWVTWDNIYYKKEPDYLTSIDKFFSFINYPTYYSSSDLKRLNELNNSPLGKRMFEHLSGWTFNFKDCSPNSDHFLIKEVASTYQCFFELRPEYAYDSQLKRQYITRYRYEHYCNSGCGPANETKYITAREGLDLISLMRLSFRSMIYNFKEQHLSEIRVFNGWLNYKEDLTNQCVSNKLI